MKNKKYKFWEFLKEHRIEIPIIQRDYAQGRIGKEELRKSFLRDLKSALDTRNEMKLDFIYGTNESNILNPLDGQQRLTTLWLLHWYIAYRHKELGFIIGNNIPNEVSSIFHNFTYETRISSREFCHKLSVFNITQPNNMNIAEHIQNQTWFRSSWRQDPTIQAMLRMLNGMPNKDKNGEEIVDGIEEAFKDCTDEEITNYWTILISDKCPIVFYYLDLLGLRQPDDLYIKMNARGEQLTSFENLKADLIGYIKEQVDGSNNDKKNWEKLLSPKDGIPIKMDTAWTNIFWKNRSSNYQIDEIYFAFINRFFFNELFTAKYGEIYLLDIGKGGENSTKENDNKTYRYLNDSANPNDYDTKIAYSGLDVYKYDKDKMPIDFFERLLRVLDRYKGSIPECNWDKTFHFIPEYDKTGGQESEIENNAGVKIKKVTALNQVQRIVFFAVCKYFRDGELTQESLKSWMRVVWNLVSGEDGSDHPQIRSTPAMRTAIEFIGKLNSHEVYKSLKDNYVTYRDNQTNGTPSDFDLRCNEEIDKANKILDEQNKLANYDGIISEFKGKTWEEVLIESEKSAFFKGSIRFLFTDDKGNENWEDFDKKWQNAQQYFGEKGVKEKYRKKAKLLRALLSRVDIDDRLWFGNGKRFWYNVLLGNKFRTISEILKGNIDIASDCKEGWLEDSKLLSTVLGDSYEQWHILSDWRGYKVLTQYSYRQPGNVNRPDQIVVLGHIRNEILKTFNVEKKISDGGFFYGWNIIFKYNDHYFQWWGDPNDKKLDVYLMNSENNDDWSERKEYVNNKNGTDKDKYYCFSFDKNDDASTFKENLKKLIEERNSFL